MKNILKSLMVLLTLAIWSCQKQVSLKLQPDFDDGMCVQYEGFFYLPKEMPSGGKKLSVCYNERRDSVIIQAEFNERGSLIGPRPLWLSFAIVLPVSELQDGMECGWAGYGVYSSFYHYSYIDKVLFRVNEFNGVSIDADFSLSCGLLLLENGKVRRKVLGYDEVYLFFYPDVLKHVM